MLAGDREIEPIVRLSIDEVATHSYWFAFEFRIPAAAPKGLGAYPRRPSAITASGAAGTRHSPRPGGARLASPTSSRCLDASHGTEKSGHRWGAPYFRTKQLLIG